jgi:hypothetical protein
VESGRKVPSESHHNETIDLSESKGKKVTVFVSHEHSDHYSPAIFYWSKVIENINYVLGWKPDIEHSYVYMAPREKKSIDDLEILTIKSTDAGVGFLVKVDGLVIFHGGDHAYWGGSTPPTLRHADSQESGKVNLVMILGLRIPLDSSQRLPFLHTLSPSPGVFGLGLIFQNIQTQSPPEGIPLL